MKSFELKKTTKHLKAIYPVTPLEMNLIIRMNCTKETVVKKNPLNNVRPQYEKLDQFGSKIRPSLSLKMPVVNRRQLPCNVKRRVKRLVVNESEQFYCVELRSHNLGLSLSLCLTLKFGDIHNHRNEERK